METKKTKRADLEKKKGVFLQIGFIIVLGLVLGAFEWSTTPDNIDFLTDISGKEIDIEEMIITRKITPPPPPPPPKVTEVINIVKKIEKPEKEFNPIDVQATKHTKTIIMEMEEEVDTSATIFYPGLISKPPKFRGGGTEEFWKYIQEEIKFPAIAEDNRISGIVYISFIIDKSGSVTDIQIARSVHPILDNEARRVIKNSPKWTPGEQMGRKVKVAYTIPVRFKLN